MNTRRRFKQIANIFPTYLIVAVFLSSCISIHPHRYTKGFHISTHGKASVLEHKVSTKPEQSFRVTDKQQQESIGLRSELSKSSTENKTDLSQYDKAKRIQLPIPAQGKNTIAMLNNKANRLLAKDTNSKQNTLNFTTQENPKEDILYILALVAMVLLILLLLKNFPLLSLLLFLIAILIVLSYFDII